MTRDEVMTLTKEAVSSEIKREIERTIKTVIELENRMPVEELTGLARAISPDVELRVNRQILEGKNQFQILRFMVEEIIKTPNRAGTAANTRITLKDVSDADFARSISGSSSGGFLDLTDLVNSDTSRIGQGGALRNTASRTLEKIDDDFLARSLGNPAAVPLL